MNLLKKGTKVSVVKGGCNASQFNNNYHKATGVYAVSNWKNKIFEIEGTIQLVSYEEIEETFCAYLLSLNGTTIGFVYNDAIEVCNVKEMTVSQISDELGYEVKVIK